MYAKKELSSCQPYQFGKIFSINKLYFIVNTKILLAMTESGKIFTAVTIGAVAGLITGLLIAPDKGSETRKKIADTARKVADNVKETANAGTEALTNFKNKFTTKHEPRVEVVSEHN